jgi:hypothetical protein
VLIVSLPFVWAENLREIAAIVVDRKISRPFVCITAISTFLLAGGSAKPLSRARLFLLVCRFFPQFCAGCKTLFV